MNKEKRSVLLLAPPYMDIYKDIKSCLEGKGFEVIWVEDCQIKGNPYNKRDIGRSTKSVDEYDRDVNAFWNSKFEEWKCKKAIDIFFAVDGFMVSHDFFRMLRAQYPGIKKCLYLYDRVKDNYKLDQFFQHYDRICTFDYSDSQNYKITHLPIYWVPSKKSQSNKYDIFALASYNGKERLEIFSRVRNMVIQEGMMENIRLYHPSVKNSFLYTLRFFVNRIRGKQTLSLYQLKKDIFTTRSLTPDEFRRSILEARVVLDTHLPYQDGLTARFMWALGAGKKIITTNSSALNYDFYSPEQILILDSDYDEVMSFIKTQYEMPDAVRGLIDKYRIDNWLKTIIGDN